jgi:hypothetical protein
LRWQARRSRLEAAVGSGTTVAKSLTASKTAHDDAVAVAHELSRGRLSATLVRHYVDVGDERGGVGSQASLSAHIS